MSCLGANKYDILLHIDDTIVERYTVYTIIQTLIYVKKYPRVNSSIETVLIKKFSDCHSAQIPIFILVSPIVSLSVSL